MTRGSPTALRKIASRWRTGLPEQAAVRLRVPQQSRPPAWIAAVFANTAQHQRETARVSLQNAYRHAWGDRIPGRRDHDQSKTGSTPTDAPNWMKGRSARPVLRLKVLSPVIDNEAISSKRRALARVYIREGHSELGLDDLRARQTSGACDYTGCATRTGSDRPILSNRTGPQFLDAEDVSGRLPSGQRSTTRENLHGQHAHPALKAVFEGLRRTLTTTRL